MGDWRLRRRATVHGRARHVLHRVLPWVLLEVLACALLTQLPDPWVWTRLTAGVLAVGMGAGLVLSYAALWGTSVTLLTPLEQLRSRVQGG